MNKYTQSVSDYIKPLAQELDEMRNAAAAGGREAMLELAIQQLNTFRFSYDFNVSVKKIEPLLSIFDTISPLVKAGDKYAAKIVVALVDIMGDMDLYSASAESAYRDSVGKIVRCATDSVYDCIKAGIVLSSMLRAYNIINSLIIASNAGEKEWCLEEGEYFEGGAYGLPIDHSHEKLIESIDERLVGCLAARGIDADIVYEWHIPDQILTTLLNDSEARNEFLALFYCRRILNDMAQEEELDEKIRKRARRREPWEEHPVGVLDDEIPVCGVRDFGDSKSIEKLMQCKDSERWNPMSPDAVSDLDSADFSRVAGDCFLDGSWKKDVQYSCDEDRAEKWFSTAYEQGCFEVKWELGRLCHGRAEKMTIARVLQDSGFVDLMATLPSAVRIAIRDEFLWMDSDGNSERPQYLADQKTANESAKPADADDDCEEESSLIEDVNDTIEGKLRHRDMLSKREWPAFSAIMDMAARTFVDKLKCEMKAIYYGYFDDVSAWHDCGLVDRMFETGILDEEVYVLIAGYAIKCVGKDRDFIGYFSGHFDFS